MNTASKVYYSELKSMKYKQYTYLFTKPITFKIEEYSDDGGYTIVSSDVLDEFVYDINFTKTIKKMALSVHLIYTKYVIAPNSELSKSAIEYKNKMSKLIKRKE